MARLGERTPSGWVIGHIRRTPVVFAPSWFLLAVVLGVIVAPTVTRVVPGVGQLTTVLAAASVPLMLLLSVLAHELCHGLAGHAVGVPPREYVLTLWGGHTQFSTEMRSPGASALVSVAGPVANAALALVAWLVLEQVTDPLAFMLWQIAALSNGIVAAFNMLPGLPLDGGRVLEALVWKVTGDRDTGTLAAGWGGRLIVVLIAAVMLGRPLLQGQRPTIITALWVVLLGSYLWASSSQAIRMVHARRRASGIDLHALAEPAVAMRADAPVTALDGPALGGRRVVLLDPTGRVAGLVEPASAAQVPAHLRPTTPLSAVARALPATSVVTVLRGASAVAAAAQVARTTPVIVLADAATGIVGVLTVARLEQALAERTRGR